MRKANLLSRVTRSPLRPTTSVPDTWLQEAAWCTPLPAQSSPQTWAGCTLSSPQPAPHAARTHPVPSFPFHPGFGGLLAEVTEITASVRAGWGWRWLIPTPSAGVTCGRRPAELLEQDQCPLGAAPWAPQQTQLSIFLAWCKSGALLSHGSSVVQCM